MPRNGSGVYSLPINYLATTGEEIQAVQHNAPLEDLAADANAVRPVGAGGTGAATPADAREALGLKIGADVQAYDALLKSIAELTTSANQVIYLTGVDTAAVATLTEYGRALMATESKDALKETFALAAVATSGAYDDLTGKPALGTAAAQDAGVFATAAQGSKADAALPRAGGTMTGDVEIAKAYPSIWLNAPGVKKARWVLASDGSLLWRDVSEQDHIKISWSGQIWTQELGNLADYINLAAHSWANSRVSSLGYRLVSLGERYIGDGIEEVFVPNGAVCVGFRSWSGRVIDMIYWRYPQVFDPVRGWLGFHVG